MPHQHQTLKLPSSVQPHTGPFQQGLLTAIVKCPIKPCPFCNDCAMLHDSLSTGRCRYPADEEDKLPVHLFDYEWCSHLVEDHSITVPMLEGLYRAMWNHYVKDHPSLLCPVEGLTLPPVYTTPAGLKPILAAHRVVPHMQLTIGLMETLHWRSSFQRCCAVCGAHCDCIALEGTTATAGRAKTSGFEGQWGATVHWRKHIQDKHLHELLLAASHVLEAVDRAHPLVALDLSSHRPNLSREAREQKQAAQRYSARGHKPGVPGPGRHDPVGRSDKHFDPSASVLPSRLHVHKAQNSQKQVMWENCWRWGGSLFSQEPSAPVVNRVQCPLFWQEPDFVRCGQVQRRSFSKTQCKPAPLCAQAKGTPDHKAATPNKKCQATFNDRETLMVHLVKYHAVPIMHAVINKTNPFESCSHSRDSRAACAVVPAGHGGNGSAPAAPACVAR